MAATASSDHFGIIPSPHLVDVLRLLSARLLLGEALRIPRS